jgi:hypothetical protein
MTVVDGVVRLVPTGGTASVLMVYRRSVPPPGHVWRCLPKGGHDYDHSHAA